MADNTKKRKRRTDSDREKLKQYGVDLPEIPGVPVQVIPLYINAVKVASKFFQHDAYSTAIPPFEMEHVQDNFRSLSDKEQLYSTNIEKQSVLDSVFHQIDKVIIKANESTTAHKEMEERNKNKSDAIQSLLEAIRRYVKDNSSTHDKSSNVSYDEFQSRKLSVPIAIMNHLFETLLDHKRIAVRRAVTHVLGYLFEKSSDCRKVFFGDDTVIEPRCNISMLDWTNATFELHNTFPFGDQKQNKAVLLLQQETYLLLLHMEETIFGRLHPTIAVAIQRFLQSCPDAVVQQDSDTLEIRRTDFERRRIRDVAIEYHQKECDHVSKLIEKTYKCVDQLVPRIGFETRITTSIVDNGNDADDDEDDDIEWEDGSDSETNRDSHQSTMGSHVDAVEHTLAVMESAGGLRDGALEIDFKRSAEEKRPIVNEEIKTVQERLVRFVRLLSERHLPRLSTWVDCHSKADRLVQVSANDVTTLVSMSSEQSFLRNSALQRLSALKQEVATILQTVGRLNLDTATKSNSETSHNSPVRIQSTNSRTLSQITINQFLKPTPNYNILQSRKRPMNRIQIKLKK